MPLYRKTRTGRAHPCAFSLIELIVIIVILAILSGVAIPKYIDYSSKAKIAAISANLKMIRRAVIQYKIDLGAYPDDQNSGVMPPELTRSLSGDAWSQAIIGVGSYNWEGPPGWAGNEAIGLSLLTTPATPTTDPFWLQVDKQIDDGNLTTGFFRWDSGSGRYEFFIN